MYTHQAEQRACEIVPFTSHFLKFSSPVDARDGLGRTNLHLAAQAGNFEEFKLLLKNKAEINAVDHRGWHTAHWAAAGGNVRILILAKKWGCSFDTPEGGDGSTPLHIAAGHGHLQAVKWLEVNSNKLKARNEKGQTPLDLAVEGRHVEVAVFLKGLEAERARMKDILKQMEEFSFIRAKETTALKLHLGYCQKFREELKVPLKPVPELPLSSELEGMEGPMNLRVRHGSRLFFPSESVYDTTSFPRGVVIIFNYKEFEDSPEMYRQGSHYDVTNLDNLFQQMGYQTNILVNYSRQDTLDFCRHVAGSRRLRHFSSLIVFIMSHGYKQRSFCASDEPVQMDEIHQFFEDSQCAAMRGKPKLFFCQFCRSGPTEAPRVEHRQPLHDTLVVYSCTEGALANRSILNGTPLIRALCGVLATHAHDTHLDDLLKIFQRKYECLELTSTPEVQNFNFKKHFYFNPLPS